MAGHNKWSKIKRKKEISDAKKSKIFSKLSQLISFESRKVSGNVNSPSLKAVIDQAKSFNMPSDNIDRAIKKGMGGDGSSLESVVYEAYGPGGVALIIEGLTGNKNKASGEIKHILGKHGGTLGAIGSVTWAFDKKGGVWEPKNTIPLSKSESDALENLVEELENNDEVQDVSTNASYEEDGE